MAKAVKRKAKPRKRATIHFRIYVYMSGGLSADVQGHVVLCDEYGKETYGKKGNIPFNHWDEVPRAMRQLISSGRRLRKKWRGKYWEFGPRSRTTR